MKTKTWTPFISFSVTSWLIVASKSAITGTTEKPRVGLDGFRVGIVSLLCLHGLYEDDSKKKDIISRKRHPIVRNTIGFAVTSQFE